MSTNNPRFCAMPAVPVRPGVVKLRGVQHIGLTVPDMKQASRFFIDMLGCELLFSEGPFNIDDARATAHNVAPGTVLHKLTLLRCASGACLELFEYRSAGQRLTPVRNIDNGGHHIAFQVDDIDAATARLREAGVAICGAVNRSKAGPFKGLAWVYFLAPWGLQLELVELPATGIGHEQATDTRLYRPA
jgi:catechol 2,3-dioxygenase-like lactoylglutathione lyase family enzyme